MATKDIPLPNGKILRVPDDFTKAEIDAIMAQESPQAPAQPTAQGRPSLLDMMKSTAAAGTETEELVGQQQGNVLPSGDTALKLLPAAGGVLASMLTKNPSYLVRGLQVGAGGASGGLLESITRRNLGMGGPQTGMERFTSPLKEGVEQGVFEGVSGPLLDVLAKVGSPVAKAFNESRIARGLYDFAQKHDLGLSPSTIVPSKLSSFVEGVTNFFLPGKLVTSKYQEPLYKKFMETRGKILGEITGTTETMAGKTLQEGIKETRTTLKAARDEAYAQIIPEGGGKRHVIGLTNTRELVDNILETPRVLKDDRLYRFLDDFNSKSPHGMTMDQFDKFQRTIWTMSNKNPEIGHELWRALEKDIKLFDETEGRALMSAITGAKDAAKNQMRYWNDRPGQEGIAQLFQKSSVVKNGEEVFLPDKFYSLVNSAKNQAYIKRQFGEDALQNMMDYAEYARRIAQENAKKGMSKAEEIAHYVGTGIGAGGSVMASPWVALPWGASFIMGHMIMKPRGVFKKWLTEGLEPMEGAGAIAQAAGRAAIAERD